MTPLCVVCRRPSPDAHLCSSCTHALDIALANIAAYCTETLLVLARQTRYTDGNGHSSDHRSPIDPNAHYTLWDVRNTLVAWVRHVMEERGEAVGYPVTTMPAMCLWLTKHIEWLRHRPEADEAWDELVHCEARMLRLIDRPLDKVYAGPCDCEQFITDPAERRRELFGLYATPGAIVVTCRRCKTSYDVKDRRAWLLAAVDDVLATKREIAEALPNLAGVHITEKSLDHYVRRGRLAVRAVTSSGDDLLRIGDVLDLSEQIALRKAS